ncbi:MAG: ATP-binding protein [Lachnospiraceae bacterium]|nr:ATP-binding protein [Lachnospiraceae bacterium]
MSDLKSKIDRIDEQLEKLPKGTLTYKTINGKKQPYLQRTVEGKSKSVYIRQGEREEILMQLEERGRLMREKERLIAYMENLSSILSRNPFLARMMSIGYQDFGMIMENQSFYVDKSHFIVEWFGNGEQVSLITRPRRFGKTLMMSMTDYFFSPDLSGHKEYFQNLAVWKSEKLRSLYGKIPVISLSFNNVKGGTFPEVMRGISFEFYQVYKRYSFLENADCLNDVQKKRFSVLFQSFNETNTAPDFTAIAYLSELLHLYYGIKPLVLLDEYDTPVSEAYISDYFDEMVDFYRGFIGSTFKRNLHFQKAVITGVARISKNSLFSDTNNIVVHSCTDTAFSDCFGFTEEEVMNALECYDIHEMMEVKENYNGFIFGKRRDMYNPWSICNYMKYREFRSYWINTSSNDLIGQLIQKYPVHVKRDMEDLLSGKSLHKKIDEDVTYQYLDGNEESFWSLLLSTGYIKADHVVKGMMYTECDISITNKETEGMFEKQIMRMFDHGRNEYNQFVDSLLKHDLDSLKDAIEELTFSSVSYFDTGKTPSKKIPENFYHGLVLGLLVSLKDRYRVVSNRESGYGRYDISVIPRNPSGDCDAFIIEFKVRDPKKEADLEATAETAIQQIIEKQYERELLDLGIEKDRIYMLGFAFEGKEVEVLQKGC